MFPHQKLDWNIRRLEKRLEEAPDDVSARVEYATACLSKAWFHEGGELWFNRTLTQARRILAGDPTSPGALVAAGASLVELDRLEPAAPYLDEALKLEPERADVRLAVGAMHHRAGDVRQAVRELEMACRLSPESWEPHAILGRLLGERAEDPGAPPRLLERSQFHIVRALSLGPSLAITPSLLHDLGVCCLRNGRYADAHKVFTRLMEHERYRAKARYYLGLVLYHMGKYKNAILYLRQHLEEGVDNPHVHARIGMAYLHLGEVEKAREACNRALAIEPADLQARWTLGCALLEEGQTDEAVKLFREILEDAPDHAPAFTEIVTLRARGRDARWLRQALRSEVSVYDRLPVTAERDVAQPGTFGPGLGRDRRRRTVAVHPRAATRERVNILLRALSDQESDEVPAILESMDLTTDEGLRCSLWEAALDNLAARRAHEAAARLKDPSTGYAAGAGREILALASVLPEPLLTRGLQIDEEDLKRAAVDRNGPARDVAAHRSNIERERQEARAWQALLLLAIATRQTRSGRNLLVRWASDADADLADAARAALAMLGDAEATERLRERARGRRAEHLVDALVATVSPPLARFHPRPVSDDEELHCSTCGRRAPEVDHMMAGGETVRCDKCIRDVARDRRELATDDPSAACGLCGRTGLETRGVYTHRGSSVCASCVDQSLGLVEREEVDRYLSAC
jgi:tetratricopeptide (TPR) repeat protein